MSYTIQTNLHFEIGSELTLVNTSSSNKTISGDCWFIGYSSNRAGKSQLILNAGATVKIVYIGDGYNNNSYNARKKPTWCVVSNEGPFLLQ
jgi:hypothetical protein